MAKRPGVSFVPALLGQGFERPGGIVVMDEYGPNRMLRDQRYKYIARYPYGPNALYDLKADPGEQDNLLAHGGFEALEQELRGRLEKWFAKYVNPEIDGAREAVFGSGQIGLAGLWGAGVSAHSCDDYIKKNPNYALDRVK